MRIIASVLALSLIGFAAPAASACRIAPDPVYVPLWDHAPTPDQVRPGEVALEIEFAHLVRSSGSSDPDIVVIGCQAFQDIFHIVRVIAGDAQDAEFVVLPGSVWMAVSVVDATGAPAPPAPKRVFVVGRLAPQRENFILAHGQVETDIPMMKPGSDLIDRAIPVLQPRDPPQ